jgi:hypothetical protein
MFCKNCKKRYNCSHRTAAIKAGVDVVACKFKETG